MNFIRNILIKIQKRIRQRNYTLIYSDKYGYGVEEKISPKITQIWFINHSDFIERT